MGRVAFDDRCFDSVGKDASEKTDRTGAGVFIGSRISRCKIKKKLAHPTRFERVTFAFGGQRSTYAASQGIALL
jgi:hypothetical protein